MPLTNPIELEGTFPLPQAQLDRFLLKIYLGYPEKDEEISILQRFQEQDPLSNLKSVANPPQMADLQQARKKIRILKPIEEYITAIVGATRNDESLRRCAARKFSMRGSLGLQSAPGEDCEAPASGLIG